MINVNTYVTTILIKIYIISLMPKHALMLLCSPFPLLAPSTGNLWYLTLWRSSCIIFDLYYCSSKGDGYSCSHIISSFLWLTWYFFLYCLQLLWTLVVVFYVSLASDLLNFFGVNIYISWKLEISSYNLFKYIYVYPFHFYFFWGGGVVVIFFCYLTV